MSSGMSWDGLAAQAVRFVARRHARFTTDQVWERLISMQAGTPFEPRRMGGVMREMHREGICIPTTDFEASQRPACHHRHVRVWESGLATTAPRR